MPKRRRDPDPVEDGDVSSDDQPLTGAVQPTKVAPKVKADKTESAPPQSTKQTGKKPQKKKPKGAAEPLEKRPQNPYFRWLNNEFRPKFKIKHPSKSMFTVTKEGSIVWLALSEKKKRVYHEEFERDMVQYRIRNNLPPKKLKKEAEDDSDDEPIGQMTEIDYEVERILNRRGRSGAVEYLVKWKGFPESENSWEPRDDLLDGATKVVEAYEQAAKKKSKAAGAKAGARKSSAASETAAVEKEQPPAESPNIFEVHVLEGKRTRHEGYVAPKKARKVAERPLEKRPLTPYFRWLNEVFRPKFKIQHPGKGMFKATKEGSKVWLALSTKEKRVYHEEFEEDMVQYRIRNNLPPKELKKEAEDDSDDEPIGQMAEIDYEVERILNRRVRDRIEYLVKWKAFPDSDNTWEPRDDLLDGARIEVERYEDAWEAQQATKQEAKQQAVAAKKAACAALEVAPTPKASASALEACLSPRGGAPCAQRPPVMFEVSLLKQADHQWQVAEHGKTRLADVPDTVLAAECARRNLYVCGSTVADLLPPSSAGNKGLSMLDLVVGHRYSIVGELGRGNSSMVYEATARSDGATYALKVMTKGVNTDAAQDYNNTNDAMSSEVAILRRLNHRCVASCIEIFESVSKFHLVLDKMSGGNLHDFVAHAGCLSEADARPLFKQLLEALQYLQELGIAHRDVKMENLLLKQASVDTIVKLCDFGLAIDVSDAKGYDGSVAKSIKACEAITQESYHGTLVTMAPEVMSASYEVSHGYGPNCDCYSAGCVLYSMLSGFYPFDADNAVQFEKIVKLQPVETPAPTGHPEWSSISSSAKAFVNSLMYHYPLGRPTAAEALESGWVLGLEEPTQSSAAACQPDAASSEEKLSGKRTRVSASSQPCCLANEEEPKPRKRKPEPKRKAKHSASALAAAWQTAMSKSTGRMYYHNLLTDKSTYDKPKCYNPPTGLHTAGLPVVSSLTGNDTDKPLTGNNTDKPAESSSLEDTAVNQPPPSQLVQETQIEQVTLPTPLGQELQIEQATLPTPLGQETQIEQATLPTPLGQEVQIEQVTLPTSLGQETQIEQATLPTPLGQEVQIEQAALPTPLGQEVQIEQVTLPTPLGQEVQIEQVALPSPLGQEVQIEQVTLPSPLGQEVQIEQVTLPTPLGQEVQIEQVALPTPLGQEAQLAESILS